MARRRTHYLKRNWLWLSFAAFATALGISTVVAGDLFTPWSATTCTGSYEERANCLRERASRFQKNAMRDYETVLKLEAEMKHPFGMAHAHYRIADLRLKANRKEDACHSLGEAARILAESKGRDWLVQDAEAKIARIEGMLPEGLEKLITTLRHERCSAAI
jgi:hypothetical protein